MKYDEWSNLETKKDKDNPLTDYYIYPSGEMFFVEPAFYTQLNFLKVLYPDKLPEIIDEMERIVKRAKKVIFCHDYEHPLIQKEGFIYIEINDVTDPLQIYVEDKSRGSDYGD